MKKRVMEEAGTGALAMAEVLGRTNLSQLKLARSTTSPLPRRAEGAMEWPRSRASSSLLLEESKERRRGSGLLRWAQDSPTLRK